MGDDLPERRRVRDAELLEALAHPLRAALVRYLMAVGPKTPSECAQNVGSSASNCSWHLRQLARLGLVEPAAATDGRQRPWRACDVGLDLGRLDQDPVVRSTQLAMVGNALNEEQTLTQRFLDKTAELEPEWREIGGLNTYSLRLTSDELAQLIADVDALIRPYVGTIREDAPAEARTVHVGLRAFPRIEADGTCQ